MALKPCPLCGRYAYTHRELIETFVGMVDMWQVSCSRFGCCEKTPLFDTLDEAINAWNSQAGQNTSKPLASSARLG